jgi:hypothetical protein
MKSNTHSALLLHDTDGLTAWFHNYQIVLPTVNGSLNYFTFAQDGRNGTMTVNSAFTTMLHTIDTTNNAIDDGKIDTFMNNIANQLKQRAMYMVFNTVKVSSPTTPIVMKKFILDNLKLRQVLADFGWTIAALGNIN